MTTAMLPFRGLQKEELVLLTHGDSVDKVADGFKVVAQSGNIIAGGQHTLMDDVIQWTTTLLSFELRTMLSMKPQDVSFDSSSDVFPFVFLARPLGIANEQKKLYGTQFHPEVDLTERGMEMLRTFLFEIAGCTSNFTVQNRQQTCISEIREKVGKSKVLVSEEVFFLHNMNILK